MSATVHDRFDETASRHSTSKTSDGSVTDAILDAAQGVGIDAIAELYNEALELAKESRLDEAKHRLQVLLGLTPHDGEAHLLLAKVHLKAGEWRKAMNELDRAAEQGLDVPEELLETAERHLQADDDEDEDERAARVAREQGELKKLRSDVRRLRSENGHLVAEARKNELLAKKWMWIGSLTSAAGSLVLLAALSGALSEAPAPAADAVADAAPVPTTTVVAAPAGAPVRDPDQKAKADAALASAGFPEAKAIIRGTKASLSGTVPTHADKKKAADAILALGVVETVDTESLVNLAARDGAVYTVASGDTLSKIALRMYGKGASSDRILDANPELGGKAGALKVGQQLKVPPEE